MANDQVIDLVGGHNIALVAVPVEVAAVVISE